jgi:cyclase
LRLKLDERHFPSAGSRLQCPGARGALSVQKAALAVSLLLAGVLVSAQDKDFSKVQIKVSRVAGNVYMLQGAGGNIAASVGEDGIVVVDDQYAPLADKIQAALKGITDKPVRFIINTHYHPDHTGGNAYFQKQAPIIAQDNVRKRLESGGTGGNMGSVSFQMKPAPNDALPIITFDHDVTVHLNGDDIRALHFPSGHTDGDSIILFPKANVVHMGDDFVRFIDLNAGGSIGGMIAALEAVIPKLPADVKVIPGHGDVSNLEDVRQYLHMLKETRAAVQNGMQQGKTLAQLKQEKVLDPWKKWSNDFISADAFIETIYNDSSGKPGTFLKHN